MTVPRFLTRFFVDDAGEPSCQRLVSFLLIVVVLGVWAWKNIQSDIYEELGMVEGGLVTTCLGFLTLKTKYEALTPGREE